MAGSRDAARVSHGASTGDDRHDADEDVDGEAASMSSELINEFLGMMLDDE